MLRDLILIAQPPLLEEEGKIRHSTIWATAPEGRCRFEWSPVGAKESQEICRPSGAYRHIAAKPRACARG